MPYFNDKTGEIENLLTKGNERWIKTSDAIVKDGKLLWPATYRRETPTDQMRKVLFDVERVGANKKTRGPLNWKILLGLKQPI